MVKDDDFDDDLEEGTDVEITEEQFSEYNCPHCGKSIQIIVAPGEDDEDEDL
ncbi:MAG: hypothetical protein Q8Q31_06020 [Nanoarchaeota archaeon]|nr:hypothetical protein [Nanoarchaeota archaeon]